MRRVRRREVLRAAVAGAAVGAVAAACAAESLPPVLWRGDYSCTKLRGGRPIRLAVYRRRLEPPGQSTTRRPVLFLVHGSSVAALASYDLRVPGRGEYSNMDVFARAGFDVWTMDHEGYGRSDRTSGNADMASGAADLLAAAKLIDRETGLRINLLGESGGAIRAAVFAQSNPERVDRLALAAFTYTGRGSATLADRARQLEFYRANARRPRDRTMIRSIFTRDRAGTTDPAVAEAMADAELTYGDSVPTGTYLDMSANLPLVDPKKLGCPVLVIRGEYDGIATNEDLLDFYVQLASREKQFSILPGIAHSLATALNRELFWHEVIGFMTMPKGEAA